MLELLILVITLSAAPGQAAEPAPPAPRLSTLPPCSPGLAPGTRCRIAVGRLHSLQGAIGLEDAMETADMYAGLAPAQLDAKLMRSGKIVPVTLAPNGEWFLFDRNHKSRAVGAAHGIDREVVAEYRPSPESLTMDQWWDHVERGNLAWPYDEHGERIPVRQLGKLVHELPNDPYRTLASRVKDAGGFLEGDWYSEFKWANFLRHRVPAALLESDPAAALKLALGLAQSPAAAGLPGYRTCEAVQAVRSLGAVK